MSTTGKAAFVMADIAGSARLWSRESDGMSVALARHDEIAAEVVDGADGTIFKHTGDGFLARFSDVERALAAMDLYQSQLAVEQWPEAVEIRSRVGVHWGAAESRDGDWFGSTVNHLARLTDLVEPTHVVVSGPAQAACERWSARVLEPLGAFGVRDIAEPLPLYSLPLVTARGPALTLAAGKGLPQFQTELVGREDDIEQVLAGIAPGRIMTLVGFGGTGKTRIAVEVAHRWTATPGRVANFVDLTSSDDPIAALADAIGLPPGVLGESGSPIAAIAKHVGQSPVLLVIDNCEHVVESAASLCADIRDHCPSVAILATTRESLELDGEWRYPLDVLPVGDAFSLFEERARLAGIPPIESPVVDRLIASVDSLPLGIELVVARLRQIPAGDLADALEADLGALRGRRRSREKSSGEQDRHTTLHSLIEWSYQLLDAEERTLLLRLSKLHGSWNRSVAAQLAPESDPDLIEELVAKSLIAMDRSGVYRILESVRQYCATVLRDDEAEAAAADDALIEWALAVAPPVRTVAGLVFDPQRTRELGEHAPNIREALAAAGRRGRGDDRGALVTGLWPLAVDLRARRWFDLEVLQALEMASDPEIREILIRLAFQGQVGEHVDSDRQQDLIAKLRAIDPGETSPVWGMVRSTAAAAEIIAARMLGLDFEAPRVVLRAAADEATHTDHMLDRAIAGLFLSFSHLLHGEAEAAHREALVASDSARACNFVPLVGLAEAAVGLAMVFAGDAAAAIPATASACGLGEGARWESSIRVVRIVALCAAQEQEVALKELIELLDFASEEPGPFVVFDAVIGVAAWREAEEGPESARVALDHTSLSRTPLTMAALLRIAANADFDLGIDRFAASFDPDAFAVRADKAADFLRAELERLR